MASELAEERGSGINPVSLRAIDAWVNPNLPGSVTQDVNVDYLFPDLHRRMERGTDLSEMIEEMDAAGIERAVLCAGYGAVDNLDWVRNAIDNHSDRFVGSILIDPREGMKAVRKLEHLVRNENFRMARVLAFQTQLPYNDAAYYPVFAKCIELDIAIGCNVGIPGPRVPGKHQHPMSLDDVCCFFPELRVIMQHGGEPWADLCVKLMLKWDNLYYMTSAFAPRRIPQPIMAYLNSRGGHKIMFASDYPLLTFDRCTREIAELQFRDTKRREQFIRENATHVILGDSARSQPTT